MTATGTALAERTEPAHPRVAALASGSVNAIVPQTFDDVFRFSQVLAKSGLCPNGMDTPEKVSVAILTGLEIGAKPMQAVQGIAVIGGRPCVWGDLALGLVRGSGTLEFIREEFIGGDPDEHDWSVVNPSAAMRKIKARCTVKRKGEPEIVRDFSVADAVVAKLWQKKGYNGKDTPWITNPKRQLQMRARGFCLRDAFTDVLKGLYLAEEIIGTDLDRPEEAPPEPPAPPSQQVTQQRQEPPAPPQTQAVGAAGPQEAVEDAEVIDERPSQEEPASRDAEPGAGQEEEAPFLFDRWIAYVEDDFAACQSLTDLDESHEGFDEIVSGGRLSRQQAEIYKDLYEAATARITASAAALARGEKVDAEAQDDDDPGFPGDDAIREAQARDAAPEKTRAEKHLDEMRAALEDPAATWIGLRDLWNATMPLRKEMIEAGEMTKETRNGLHADFGEVMNRISLAGNAEDAGPPVPPSSTTQKKEGDDNGLGLEDRAQVLADALQGFGTDTEFDAAFLETLKGIDSVELINAFAPMTLKKRNSFGSDNPLRAKWMKAVTDRRNKLNGL